MCTAFHSCTWSAAPRLIAHVRRCWITHARHSRAMMACALSAGLVREATCPAEGGGEEGRQNDAGDDPQLQPPLAKSCVSRPPLSQQKHDADLVSLDDVLEMCRCRNLSAKNQRVRPACCACCAGSMPLLVAFVGHALACDSSQGSHTLCCRPRGGTTSSITAAPPTQQ